jgi:protein ImuB
VNVACVDLPSLPLQLVWRQRPDWRAHPVVVIDEDRPQGLVQWACERARAQRVLPGQRYAHALSLCAGLRAQVVGPEVIAAAEEELIVALSRVSPRVEVASAAARMQPARSKGKRGAAVAAVSSAMVATGAGAAAGGGRVLVGSAASRPKAKAKARLKEGAPAEARAAGTFWLDGEGLARLYGDGVRWGAAILEVVAGCGYAAVAVVGFARFATYAIARSTSPARTAGRPIVFSAEDKERQAARAVALSRLEIDPKLRDTLARLGVTTLGEMVRLPGSGVLERFGAEAHRLHQLAAGERWDPLVPVAPPETLDERVLLDDEERQIEGLMFVAKGALDRLLARLAERKRALTALHVELRLRHAVHELETRTETIKPAEPTLDSRALLRLLHLRLEGAPPSTGVVELRLFCDDVLATREQLALFAEKPRRDPRAAAEVLARLRAELGEDAVVTPILRDGHLPEAQFGWQRIPAAALPAPPRPSPPPPGAPLPLVRRIFARPHPLPSRAAAPGERPLPSLLNEHGALLRLHGPYVLSGGWWATELHREYHFAETEHGHCLWLYFDRNRHRWFWQGEVE